VQDIERALGACRRQALASLIRALGDFDAAEDALQEASARALVHWPTTGIPDAPVAWLLTAARRIAIDRIRSRARRRSLASAVAETAEASVNPWERLDEARLDAHLDDDVLRLLFTCCHPALAPEIQLALALRTIAGLSVDEVARALLVSADAMEQRLTRAKRKIRDAGIRYEVPPPHRLDAQLPPVLRVLYLVFNEGYAPTAGTAPIRSQLCEDAIRMARQLARAFRADPEARGLLALMLLQSARAEARFVGDTMVPLDAQDRTRWDHARIAEGTAILKAALVRHRPGPYQIQAAIAAVHCEAPSAEATDWPEIVGLYEQLYGHEPTPVVRLNHAAACVQAGDVAAASALIATISGEPVMARHASFHAVEAACQSASGLLPQAAASYRRAIALTRNPFERAFLEQKLRGVEADVGTPPARSSS
jgi:RNA polymerase sigma-70 factor (ECF subfamily)